MEKYVLGLILVLMGYAFYLKRKLNKATEVKIDKKIKNLKVALKKTKREKEDAKKNYRNTRDKYKSKRKRRKK